MDKVEICRQFANAIDLRAKDFIKIPHNQNFIAILFQGFDKLPQISFEGSSRCTY
jgi:hypothetical protein